MGDTSLGLLRKIPDEPQLLRQFQNGKGQEGKAQDNGILG